MATQAKTMAIYKLVYLSADGLRWLTSIDHPNDFATASAGQKYRKAMSAEDRKIYKLAKFTSTRRFKL